MRTAYTSHVGCTAHAGSGGILLARSRTHTQIPVCLSPPPSGGKGVPAREGKTPGSFFVPQPPLLCSLPPPPPPPPILPVPPGMCDELKPLTHGMLMKM